MKKMWLGSMLAASALVFAGCNTDDGATGEESGEGGAFEPSSNIEVVAPAGAGGGWDTTAREVARVFGETGMIEENMTVINREGGGGAIGWAYVHGKDGDPHSMFVASPPLMFVPLNGQSEHGHEDFTPIANVIADYGAFAVHADSEWEDLNDLFDQMKEDPQSVTVIGTSAPGSMDHMQFVRIAKAAGVDATQIKYVSDQEGGALTAVLNGSVDVFSTGVGETIEQVRAGNIKVLGITAEERMTGDVLSDFPTAMEQGIDEEFVNWRGFFGPPNMEPAAVEYYEAKFKELSDSEEFAEVREKYGWTEMYMGAEEYKEFLDNEKEEIQALLEEIGLGN